MGLINGSIIHSVLYLGSLVEPLKGLIVSGPSEAELTLALRQTDAYKKRFAANAQRIASGLRALSEGEYVQLEDQYQNIMRNYGLPATYYTKDATGKQEGFEKFIAGDVSPTELEDRVVLAQQRVLNAAPEVTTALKQFYPDITNGEILAYTLDPSKGLADIKKKITAAEIGGAALGARLGATVGRAEELARYGVTAETARAGFGAIGGGAYSQEAWNGVALPLVRRVFGCLVVQGINAQKFQWCLGICAGELEGFGL